MSDTSNTAAATPTVSFFSEIGAELESAWKTVETLVVDDVEEVGTAIKNFLIQIAPSQFSVLLQVAEDAIGEIITDPATAITAILNDLEAKELAWWKSINPAVQSALASTAAGLAATNKAVLASASGASS